MSPAEVAVVFAELERRLDAQAAAVGELSLTVPFVCITAQKPAREGQ